MKTQKHILNFKKASVSELNDAKLISINGGSTPACVTVVMAFVASFGASYAVGQNNDGVEAAEPGHCPAE